MPPPTLLSILDRVGLLVGGTQPNAAASPHFYSGSTVGDGTGVAGLNGCYAIPEDVLTVEPPLALLLPDSFTAMGPAHSGQLMQGNEDNEDLISIWVLLWRQDLPTQFPLLVPFRDSMPALFRQHMQLGGLIDVDAFITHGRTGVAKWAGTEYLIWDFTLRIRQLYSITYGDS